MIGIIGAMDEEVIALKEAMTSFEVITKASMDFYKGVLFDKEVWVVKAGIGKVNAGICTQILIDVFQVRLVINTGIAGSLNAKIDIGDIVLSTDLVQHDVDAVAFGYDVGQIPRMDVFSFQADEETLQLAYAVCKDVCPSVGVHKGRIVSGDQFVADRDRKNYIKDTFNAYCTEMEGAAIGQTAYLNHVPFLVIRAISDKADDSANLDYPTFERMAIDNSVKLLKKLIVSC